jgi:6-phosphogluconolactonase (cycloisomerase 2 family)
LRPLPQRRSTIVRAKAKEKRVLRQLSGRSSRFTISMSSGAITRAKPSRLPAGVQYAWPHPSKRYFYVASSNGQPGGGAVNQGNKHYASAFRIDPASGALTPHGQPLSLPRGPIHISVDGAGVCRSIAYNDPSNLTVHRINAGRHAWAIWSNSSRNRISGFTPIRSVRRPPIARRFSVLPRQQRRRRKARGSRRP